MSDEPKSVQLISTTTESVTKKKSHGKKQLVSVEQLRQDILKQAGIDTDQLAAYVRDSFAVAHAITINAEDDNTKLKAIGTMTQLVQTYVLPKQHSTGTNIQINNEAPYQPPTWAAAAPAPAHPMKQVGNKDDIITDPR